MPRTEPEGREKLVNVYGITWFESGFDIIAYEAHIVVSNLTMMIRP
jgi:hypothetical protein